MASRMYRIGSIFTRTNGLIQNGLISKHEIPLWFDLYYHFPPDQEPVFEREAPDVKVTEIFYEEDVIRAKIQTMLPKNLGVVNLDSKTPSKCQRLINLYQQYTKLSRMSDDEALKKIINEAEEVPQVDSQFNKNEAQQVPQVDSQINKNEAEQSNSNTTSNV